MNRDAGADWKASCARLVAALLPALRECARRHGYAIGVHGSLAYDIDLIACPWQFNACEPRRLAEALQKVIESTAGAAFDPDIDANAEKNPVHAEHRRNGSPGLKPFGRLVWVFHLGGGPYIDLSVMPKGVEAPTGEAAKPKRRKRRK